MPDNDKLQAINKVNLLKLGLSISKYWTTYYLPKNKFTQIIQDVLRTQIKFPHW